MHITAHRIVHAPVSDVFGVFSDIGAAADRIDGITKIDILSEVRQGLGTRWRETRIMMGREATEEMEISEFDPPTRYVVTAESRGTRYRSTYDFVERGEDTEVNLVFEGTPVSLGAKALSILGFLFKGQARKAFEADMADLAAVCEARRT